MGLSPELTVKLETNGDSAEMSRARHEEAGDSDVWHQTLLRAGNQQARFWTQTGSDRSSAHMARLDPQVQSDPDQRRFLRSGGVQTEPTADGGSDLITETRNNSVLLSQDRSKLKKHQV